MIPWNKKKSSVNKSNEVIIVNQIHRERWKGNNTADANVSYDWTVSVGNWEHSRHHSLWNLTFSAGIRASVQGARIPQLPAGLPGSSWEHQITRDHERKRCHICHWQHVTLFDWGHTSLPSTLKGKAHQNIVHSAPKCCAENSPTGHSPAVLHICSYLS